MLEITYIGHSGFLVELTEAYLLFDYYEGKLPERDLEKPLYVFSSHGHADHFNPAVFDLLAGQKTIYGIFSKDIPKKKVPENPALLEKWFVGANQIYTFPEGKSTDMPGGIQVETLRSTDRGVAFLVSLQGVVIYHGGDLNDWYWEEEPEHENRQMTKRYQDEIKKLSGRKIDVAFAPLDSRQKDDCDRGLAFLLETTEAEWVVPMHFWEQPEVIDRFLAKWPQYQNRICALRKPLDKERL